MTTTTSATPRSQPQQVSWSKPLEGWVKLNVDGSRRSEPPSSAIGGVLRNSDGSWIVGFSNKVGHASVLESEIRALRDGLSLAWTLGYHKVEVASDSQVTVQLLLTKDFEFHPLGALLEDCRKYLLQQWDCRLHHSLREANQVADALAELGLEVAIGSDSWIRGLDSWIHGSNGLVD
ncbi:unnamed protein product [Linum tenue]|uniref:RNase H type-1 domain-containing protein n=1 Tax=Linum tenue TaxID=586396 RepID=A0AAV0GRF7_9ROSI|nr:unnamed protein product [Linum tenue]